MGVFGIPQPWYNIGMDAYTKLAYTSIIGFLETGKKIALPDELPREMLSNRAGVFVSIHLQKNNRLRGCIGTFEPTKKCIAEEIVNNALSAAFDDPRFPPVSKEETNNLKVSVDILSEPEKVIDIKMLDPKKFGLIVANQDGRRGLLLPNIGVDSAEEQIDICCEKGGISRDRDQLNLFRFTVQRHE